MTYIGKQAQAKAMEYLTTKYICNQNMFLQDLFSRQAKAITVVAMNDDKIDNYS